MTHTNTAKIETLTAEVRVLVVGSRQVTLSVFRQLDRVSPERITPFGRVRSGAKYYTFGYGNVTADLELVGTDEHGNLVRSVVVDSKSIPASRKERYAELQALPLIVLAGLK